MRQLLAKRASFGEGKRAGFGYRDDESEDVNSGALPAQIGKYWVKQLLGTGGMGRVFLAVDPDIGREVAIKLVTLGSDPQAS